MMIPAPANPIIKMAISDILIKEQFGESQTCFDVDDVSYKIEGVEEENYIKFSYSGNDSANIMKNGGQEMLETIYKDYMMDPS